MEANENAGQAAKRLRGLWADQRSFGKRLVLALFPMLAAGFTFVFFGPLEMVAFAGDSLAYTYRDILWLLIGAAAAVVSIGSLLLALLRGKIYNYAVSTVFALTLAGYLQAALMNGSLGLLTGDGVDWTVHRATMLSSLFVWVLVLLIVLFFMYLDRKIWKKMVALVSALVVVMQLAPTALILAGTYDQETEDEPVNLTISGMEEFSSGDNIFVFVLDRLDYDYMEQALEADPDFLAGLDGFTSYTNAISAYARTRPALAALFSGDDDLAYRVAVNEFYREAWTDDGGNILKTLQDQGYSVEAYTHYSYLFADRQFAKNYVRNVSTGGIRVNGSVVLPKLLQLSAYRYAPVSMKPFFWADTNYYNADAVRSADSPAYEYDDVTYAQLLKQGTAKRKESSFKLYHFFGSHAPYSMNADGTLSQEQTTVTDQTLGSFANLTAIFNRMKELGIYEDATIIITGDHGSAVSDTKPISKETRIGLLYKPSGSVGTPVQESKAPVSTVNIAATIAKAAGADASVYGRALDEIGENEEITRVTYKSIMDGDPLDEVGFYTYHVTGDASDLNNWVIVDYTEIEKGDNFY